MSAVKAILNLGVLATLVAATRTASAQSPSAAPPQEKGGVPHFEGDTGNFVIEQLDEKKARKVFARVGINRIIRSEGQNFVTLEFAKGDPEQASRVAGPTATANHPCKRKSSEDEIQISFQCEVFRRVLPPDAAGNTEVPPVDHGGLEAFSRGYWTSATVIVAGGRFYNSGVVSQVFTDLKITITDTNNKVREFFPKAKKGGEPLPRFDGTKFTGTLARLDDKNDPSVGVGVVTWDAPALAATEAPNGPNSVFIGQQLSVGDRIQYKLVFSTYLFEDCDADQKVSELPTHRADWSIDIRGTVAGKLSDSTGRVIQGTPEAQIVADPSVDANSAFGKAVKNNPSPESDAGLQIVPGAFEVK